MSEKPPPYTAVPPMGPPPPYQQMPPTSPYHQMPPTSPPPAPVGFATGYPAPGGSTTIITTQQPSYGTLPVVVNRSADVIVVGGCPACRVTKHLVSLHFRLLGKIIYDYEEVGVLSEDFTLAGLCCAFWFFPIGILCCLAMRERRCSNCGACFT